MASGAKTLKPKKYFEGLSNRQATRRAKEISRGKSMSHKNPAAYKPFATDKGMKTKKSGYTRRWYKRFPKAKSLDEKSKAAGVPLKYVKQVYNRGLAAWRTGHRPGATPQQWAYSRVHSFLLKGKTYRTADSDIAAKVSA